MTSTSNERSTSGRAPAAANPAEPETIPPLSANRDFLILWTGQFVSWMGTGLVQAAYPLLVFHLTNSGAQAGLSLAMVALPRLLFALPAGALVDRLDRKRVMMAANVVRSCCSLAIVSLLLLGVLKPWHLYLIAFADGIAAAFFDVADAAALPQIVHPSHLPNANARNQLGMAASSIVGPILGGALFNVWAPYAPFLVEGVTFLIAAYSLLWVRARLSCTPSQERSEMVREIREGVAWSAKHPPMAALAMGFGAMQFFFACGMLMCITRAMDLGADGAAVGTLFSFSAIGSMLGATLAGRLIPRLHLHRVMFGSLLALSAVFPAVALVPHYLLIGLVGALLLVIQAFFLVGLFTYRGTAVPEQYQGRVASLFSVSGAVAQPLGFAAGGIFLDSVGSASGSFATAGLMAAWILALVLRRDVRLALSAAGGGAAGSVEDDPAPSSA